MRRALLLVSALRLPGVVGVDATKPVLLITGDKGSPKVMLTSMQGDGVVVDVLRSVLTKDLRQGTLCMPDMSCATVTDIKLLGLSGRESLGVPWSMYLILLVVGLFTLSIPVRLRLDLAEAQVVNPSELAKLLTEAVRKNPGHYTRASASDIESRLQRAKTFAQMRRAFE
jgi:hypothetical protein